MITKKRLLKMIEEAIQTEEQLVAIYCQTFLLTDESLGGGPEARGRQREAFEALRDESRSHRSTLDRLHRTVAEDKRNAY